MTDQFQRHEKNESLLDLELKSGAQIESNVNNTDENIHSLSANSFDQKSPHALTSSGDIYSESLLQPLKENFRRCSTPLQTTNLISV